MATRVSDTGYRAQVLHRLWLRTSERCRPTLTVQDRENRINLRTSVPPGCRRLRLKPKTAAVFYDKREPGFLFQPVQSNVQISSCAFVELVSATRICQTFGKFCATKDERFCDLQVEIKLAVVGMFNEISDSEEEDNEDSY
ncbi:hypothetical protein K0M31_005184 [Melipona bicolor]|uniref:Uncharacterized protein n=1 Tax=Melipona bicolor TaxID=60889 RepID=A0AA40FV36_9HYME|nr:hypothetical protein K0M31_005184 [Melipona bicolor]